MKIRTGFVSNSSSSSFVCDICGATESGFDTTPKEMGFVRCENDHMICKDEAYGEGTEDSYAKDKCGALWSWVDLALGEKFCPICLFEVSSKLDIKKYLKNKYGVTEEEVFAIVKEKNKKRKKLYESEYINYVYEKFNIQEKVLLDELKEKYGSYKKFTEDLNK